MFSYKKGDKKEFQHITDYGKLIDGWISYIKNDKENFLKDGTVLFMFVIKVHDLKLIDDIYKKCLNYFKKDLENHKEFLGIITTSMPLLKKYYPEYITKYSLDTNMIIDSIDYKIEHVEHYNTLHLYPFSKNIQLVNLTRSILLTKYQYKMVEIIESDSNISNTCFLSLKFVQNLMILIFYIIEILILTLTFPISFPIFCILNYFHLINSIYYHGDMFSFFYYCLFYYFSYVILDNITSLLF